MIKATLFVESKNFKSNQIFGSKYFDEKGLSENGFVKLKEELKQLGIDISTQDINNENDSIFVIYFDVIPYKIINQNSYLILMESESIKPNNWQINRHHNFRKIFTWNNDLVDNHRYIKINFFNDLKILSEVKLKSKNLVQISANKFSRLKNELYFERKKIIKWHEKNHFKFDFYGYNWDIYLCGIRILDFFLKKIRIPVNYSNYRGSVKNKFQVLNNYNFSYCLENFDNHNGYITEKIIDCFKTLTIPIYKGHSANYLEFPRDTFILYDDFDSLEDLNKHITNLSNSQILCYQNNIKKFITSNSAFKFSNEFFVEQLIKNIEFD